MKKETTATKTVTPKLPTGPVCPKCGEKAGWIGPHYQKGTRVTVRVPASPIRFRDELVESIESLDYVCKACGYVRHEPCKDVGMSGTSLAKDHN